VVQQLILQEDKRTFLIVGGGPAGLTCAETLRQEGFAGRIVMMNKEKALPYVRSLFSLILSLYLCYLCLSLSLFWICVEASIIRLRELFLTSPQDRPKLSKAMTSSLDSILLRKPEFFSQHSIEARIGVEVRLFPRFRSKKTFQLTECAAGREALPENQNREVIGWN
jgi:hypothetical protein